MSELPSVSFRNSKSCHDWSQVTSAKKNFIKTMNKPSNHIIIIEYQRPSQFSAWPSHLTYSDLSLIQPPANAGTHANENDRFRERK